MKTISELNAWWWYRLLKVVSLFLLLAFIVGTPIGIFINYGPQYDNDNSYIKCANGKTFKLEPNGIYTYSDYLDSYDIEKAEGLCFDGTIEVVEDRFGEKRPQITSRTTNSGKYELISIYTERDWVATIGFTLLSIVGYLVFFEIVRRVFYYILLGSIRPQK